MVGMRQVDPNQYIAKTLHWLDSIMIEMMIPGKDHFQKHIERALVLVLLWRFSFKPLLGLCLPPFPKA